MEGQIIFSRNAEEVATSGVGGTNYLLIEKLRAAMAEVNQGAAWYNMVVTVEEDGKFKFNFDYDHLPTFDILRDPADWEREFKTYPRPELQAHVQDWIDGKIKDEDWKTIIQRLSDLNPSSNP